jgi:hypothetical protein
MYRIGIATTSDTDAAPWAAAMTAQGYTVAQTEIRGHIPDAPVDLWVIDLDAHTPPNAIALWVRRLAGRIVLITPHLQAGQQLAEWVPALAVVCAPAIAATALRDLLLLTPAMAGGCTVLARQEGV